MSDIFQGIFGGKKASSTQQSTSNSYNQAYPFLQQAYSPQVSNGVGSSNSLAALLGVGGDPTAQRQAFDTWKNSTGYQFGRDQGVQAITGSNAAKGLLDSGSTAKAVDEFGQNYANTQYGNYTGTLQSLMSGGNQAGSIIGGAGNTSQSQSTGSSNSNEKPGIAGFIGKMLSAGASGG